MIRIPEGMNTDKEEYYINKIGETYIAYPVGHPWAVLQEVMGTFSSDFLLEGEQPARK